MYNNTKQLNEDISDYLAISKDNNIQLFESISRRDSTYTIVYVDLYNDRIMTSNTDNEGVRHMKKMFPDENSKAKVFKNIEKRAIAAYKKQLEEEGYDIINESTQNTVGMAVGGGAVLATVVAKVTSEYKKLAAKESPASFKARKKLLLEALQAAINEVQNATA